MCSVQSLAPVYDPESMYSSIRLSVSLVPFSLSPRASHRVWLGEASIGTTSFLCLTMK